MKPTPPRRLSDIIQATCLVAGTKDAPKVLGWLEDCLAQHPIRGDETAENGALLHQVLSDAMIEHVINKHGRSDEESHRCTDLASVATIMVHASANPLPAIAELIGKTHSTWLCSVIDALAEQESRGNIHRLHDGGCILHALCANEQGHLEFLMKIAPAMKVHPDWFTCARNTDGATALHVLWSSSEGGPHWVARRRDMGGTLQWMAYEHHGDTVRETRVFMDQGSKLMSTNHAGQTVVDLMVQAREGGFWDWMPNEAGVDWILPILRDFDRVLIDRATCEAAAQGVPTRL
jgi:hypothetical protein